MWRQARRYCYFVPMALDSKAGTGLATPVNPIAEHTTININVGVVLDPKPWDG